MNPSRRSLLVFSAAAGAAAGLSATASADHPVHSTVYRPSYEVCRQSLAGTPGSFSDPGVQNVLGIMDQALASDPAGSAIVAAVGVALEAAYPGDTSMDYQPTTYSYIKDPVTGVWHTVCTQHVEGHVYDDPSDPIVIAIGISMPVV